MSKGRKDDRIDRARDFIESVVKGDNVGAKEKLERILKEKTARRIKDTLAS